METSTQRSKGRGMIGKKRSHAKQGAARMLGFSAGVGMTHCDIRRLARRGGVKRISAGVYDDVRDALRTKLSRWIQRIATVVEHSQRHTVTPFDVVYALKHDGITLYGFGEREGPLHATTKKQRRPLGARERQQLLNKLRGALESATPLCRLGKDVQDVEVLGCSTGATNSITTAPRVLRPSGHGDACTSAVTCPPPAAITTTMPALQQQQAAQSAVAANIAAAADPCPVEAPLLLHQGAVPQHSTGEQVVEEEATAAASAALLAEDSITHVPCSLPDACAEANTAAVRMLPADSVTAGVLTNGPCASVANSGSSNVVLAGSTSTIAAVAPAGNTSAIVQPAAWRLVREHLEDVLQAYCKVCEAHPYEQCIEFSASDVCRHLSPQATLLSTLGLGQAGAAAGALDGPNDNHNLASENSAHGGGDGAVALPLAVCGSGVQAEVQRILEYLTQLQGAPKCPQTGAYTPSLVFDADEGKFYTC